MVDNYNQSKQQESLLDSKPQIIIKPPIHSNFTTEGDVYVY
jgi:hypothetical protein